MGEEWFPVTAHVNMDIKADLTPVIKAIADIAKSPHKGLCKLGMSILGPFIAAREVKASHIRTQGKIDNEAILNKEMEFRDGKLQKFSPPESLALQIVESFNQSDFQRFIETLKCAAEKISKLPEEEISDDPIDTTFCNFWRKDTESIDDEKLRQIWADLLVQEVKKANSVSVRTLNVVKNITKQEAELFERLCKGIIMPYDPQLLVNAKDIPLFGTYAELYQLVEAGLISSANSSYTSPNLPLEIFPVLCGNYMIKLHRNPLVIKCHMLTNAGKEIMNVLNIEKDLDAMIIIAKELSRQHGNALVEIMSSNPTSDNSCCFDKIVWSNAENK